MVIMPANAVGAEGNGAPCAGKVEVTAQKTMSEKSAAGRDKKKLETTKNKTGLMKIIAVVLGYLTKKSGVADATSRKKLKGRYGRGKKEQCTNRHCEVLAEGIMDEEKFTVLSQKAKFEALTERMEQLKSAYELETSNVAVIEANVTAKTEISVDTAQGDVITEKTEMPSPDYNSPENVNLDSGEQQGTDESDEGFKRLKTEYIKQRRMYETLKAENEKLASENDVLETEFYILKVKKKTLEDVNGQLTVENATLKKEKEKLESENEELNTKHVTLSGEYSKLQIAHDQYKRCKELEESEVGQLEVTVTEKDQEITRLQEEKNAVEQELSEEQSAKNAINQQLQEARRTIENQKGALREKKEDIRILNSAVKEKEKQICDLKMANNGLNAEIEGQQNELAARQTTIDLQAEEIGKLKEDKDSLQSENTALNRLVEGLQQEKEELTQAKRAVEQELDKKTELICAEREDFAKMMISLAKKLSAAADSTSSTR